MFKEKVTVLEDEFICVSGNEEELIHVKISPRIVTKRGNSLDDVGSMGSGHGLIRTQLSAAPPEMAPIVRNSAGDVRSLFVLDKL